MMSSGKIARLLALCTLSLATSAVLGGCFMNGVDEDAGVDAGLDAGADAGYDAGFDAGFDAGTDSGGDGSGIPPGTVTVNSSGNRLPAPWTVTTGAVFRSDNTGAGASAHVAQLVRLNTPTTVSIDPCPLPYGTVCDGFSATDGSGNAVVVDTYSFLGTTPPCLGTLPTGGTLPSISGIWQSFYNATTKVTTWTIAPTDCSGIGLGEPYSGTGTPPASAEVHALRMSFQDGLQVTVRGVVVGVWASGAAFGFTIQDPGGGEESGISVHRSKTSASTAAVPAVGDYVTVTGTTRHMGTVVLDIML